MAAHARNGSISLGTRRLRDSLQACFVICHSLCRYREGEMHGRSQVVVLCMESRFRRCCTYDPARIYLYISSTCLMFTESTSLSVGWE